MGEIYEVVIFTAAMQNVSIKIRFVKVNHFISIQYADWVLDRIDTTKCIQHRLYRQHATYKGPGFVKDLSNLGRDLSKTIIVDNLAENFALQPDNGIFIKTWLNDQNDTALSELSPLLKEITNK